jgi:hypothetical protein
LVKAANGQFAKMWELIDSMSDNERDAEFNLAGAGKEAHWERDKNLRDALVHLHEWHQLLLDWVTANQNGEPRPFLPSPYNWRTYGDMNLELLKKHQRTSYEEAKGMLHDSHEKVMALIDGLPNEALFTKDYFPWAGTSTLGSYCVSATSSHYDWAMKKLRAHLKALRV